MPQRGDRGIIFLDDYILKAGLPGPGESFLGYKISKRLGEDLHLKGAKKEFTIANFVKYML